MSVSQFQIINFIILIGFTKIISSFEIITRDKWGARPPIQPQQIIPNQLQYVIIHHSAIPLACYTQIDCQYAMRQMQDMHQLINNWNDIGYSFGIGGDGEIYEGRGFNVVGAHAPGFNDKSVGICLIGDWSEMTPPSNMLRAVQKLIDYGLGKNFISSSYIIHGHRQIKDTECPGTALYNEIMTWPHFGLTV